MLGDARDVFRLRQVFDVAVRVREVGRDLPSLDVARRAIVPLPFDPGSPDLPVFPALTVRARPSPATCPRPDRGGRAGRRGRRVHRLAGSADRCARASTAQLARENLARLERETEVVMIEPVAYEVGRGLGFYQQFLDTAEWPSFIPAGREHALDALAHVRHHHQGGAA